jgi:hypothetical protein
MQFKMSIKQQHTLGGNGCLSAASGRSCDRLTDRTADHLHTCFLASSVLQTNVVTVPKIPSCYWMFLMHPSRFKFVKMKPPCFKFKRISKLCTSAWTETKLQICYNPSSEAQSMRVFCHGCRKKLFAVERIQPECDIAIAIAVGRSSVSVVTGLQTGRWKIGVWSLGR